MEIIGTGIDATEIARIGAAIERYGDRFVQRIFTEEEIAYCRRKRDAASSFAARFAAKEAAMKALGTGHSRGVFWRGIEVVPARRPAAAAVSWRRRRAVRGDGRHRFAPDAHALAGARHRPRPARATDSALSAARDNRRFTPASRPPRSAILAHRSQPDARRSHLPRTPASCSRAGRVLASLVRAPAQMPRQRRTP